MELRQLRSLVAIADDGTFTAAAARLHLAQPALSQQIARLERELGVSLLDRTTRRVTLTQAGDVLVDRARRALGEVDAATAELGALRGVELGALAVGVTPTTGPVDIAALLSRFHAHHPAVELILRSGLTTSLYDALRRDELDLALVTGEPRDELEAIELASEPLVAMVAPGHRLAARRRIRLPDLAAERIVGFSRDATIRVALERAAAAGDQPLRTAFEVDDANRVRALVAAGLGVGVLPQTDAEAPGPPVVLIQLVPTLTHRVSLVWRASRRQPPAAKAFIALVRRDFPSRQRRVSRADADTPMATRRPDNEGPATKP